MNTRLFPPLTTAPKDSSTEAVTQIVYSLVNSVMSGIVANGSLGANKAYILGHQTNIIPGELEGLNWIKMFTLTRIN